MAIENRPAAQFHMVRSSHARLRAIPKAGQRSRSQPIGGWRIDGNKNGRGRAGGEIPASTYGLAGVRL
jgi:hypothetical protein